MRSRFGFGYLYSDEFMREHSDEDSLEHLEMMYPYELIHVLLSDICRLVQLVIDTRDEVNSLSLDRVVYCATAQDVIDAAYDGHPALVRYIELYGADAIIPWES
ncbi:MAG: hypothetical protein FWH01_16355 [Oscillospiraceae bacterium]|nr:hypothetical protein [Oscillospiraceae bacterium]